MKDFKQGSLLLLVLFFLLAPYLNPGHAQAATSATASVEVIGDNGQDLQAPTAASLSSDSTALSILQSVVGEKEVTLTNGMITTIKGLTSPADWSAYWNFYINGVAASVGADQYRPTDQDVLLFQYHPGKGLLNDEVSLAVNSKYGKDVKLNKGLTVLSSLQKLEGQDHVTVKNNQITGISGTNADATHIWDIQLTRNGKTQNVTDLSTPLQGQDQLSFTPVVKKDTTALAQKLSVGQLNQAIQLATSYVNKNGIDDWDAMALSRAGETVPTSYLTQLEKTVNHAKGQFHAPTDTEKYVLGSLAAGGDPTNSAGYNLVKNLYNGQLTKQGLNGVIFGLIALESADFNVPAEATWTPDKMDSYLLSHQNKDGGWAWDGSTTSDLDTTGMVLTALSKQSATNGVNQAIQKAETFLADQYQQGKVDNSSTAATLIIGLTANNVNPEGASFTLKDGTTLASDLLSFQGKDGGFVWQKGKSEDSFSTDQGFRGLVAEQLYQSHKGTLYTFDWKKRAALSTSGSTLPNTATPYYNIIILGFLLILVGVTLKKKRV